MTLRKSAFQSKGLSLAGLSVDISCNSSVMDNKFLSFSFGVKRDPAVAGFSTSTLATSTRTREGEFCASIKKGLPTIANPVYGYSAPAKSGAGRGNPNTLRATQTPKASFFVSDHYAHQISGLVRTVSMVALVGLRSRRPVSFVSGISTPANVTAISERGNSGGDSLNTKEAAYMLATTPTQKPSFIWLIAAVRRDMPTITAKIHHIAAETEQEARRSLARDHVCFFAGRIRTGGAHA
ncbi:host cell division inhibitor Icd-like protein [Klebsiella quasipneumoniae subsp. similipneumoniae]|uniref:Host cell division inhibitor Icd-like protein n=1 Tax=Klebsiella quasipneumoniae subsp. similipneumoniae TaxID=1463164 RepID=A0AAE4MPB3_9ENTR|nr:host cell division inhibitor Icd-like protein [Klebsiella quasipneumoniae]MDV0610684.1 host cell division inhibitor Icd-like protein [Klebsiella quasipneumoniae subsp. similipneumoniae]MDV0638288.1 host cell division inhibitor Icd-like protein [Klebsiella quasipneumoniae subsp. similipneumoniae]MDV0725637.1 host cell division inhibitor Icd-like protein [Klebsiella quasipneumoniae subsp. similipneumoniae]MDV0737068.1 host cell division inhibitor Icd-like protein [Klebsiella quasipneumoniae su